MQELVSARDTNLADLVRKYKRDSQALTGRRGRQAQEEADQLAARHYEEMETAQKAFSSALADLTSNQRRRYVSFIEQLYAEYVAAIGPERGSEAERDAIAELVKGDSECGRRMVLRAMEASNFGRSEGGLRDLGTSDEQAPDLLPTRTRTPQITVQMQSLEELEVSGVEEEENEATSRSEQGTFDPDDGASTASRSAVTRTPSPSPAAVMDRPASPLTPPSSLRAKGRSESGTLQSDETILKPVNLGDRMINYLVGELISMGFDLEMSQAALQMSGQRLDQAINLLLEHPRDIRQFIEAKTAHASPVAPPAPIPMTITKERPGTGLLQRLPNSPPRGGPHFLDKQAEPQPASRSASSSSLSRWRESLQRQRSTIIGGESQEGAPSRTVSQSTKMDTANAGPPSTSPPKPGQPDFSFARRSAASPVPSLSTDQKLPRSPSRGSDSDREPGTGNNALKRLGTLFSKVGQPSGKDKTETKASNREERDSREAPEPLKPERFFIWEPDISETFTVWQGTHGRCRVARN